MLKKSIDNIFDAPFHFKLTLIPALFPPPKSSDYLQKYTSYTGET